MATIHKIPTRRSLFHRITRTDAGMACLVLIAICGACALAEIICTLTGAGLQP